MVQVARWYLLRHLHAKGDEELIKVSTPLPSLSSRHTPDGVFISQVHLQHAKAGGDERLLTFHSLLSGASL